jgi:hypothetical protein
MNTLASDSDKFLAGCPATPDVVGAPGREQVVSERRRQAEDVYPSRIEARMTETTIPPVCNCGRYVPGHDICRIQATLTRNRPVAAVALKIIEIGGG